LANVKQIRGLAMVLATTGKRMKPFRYGIEALAIAVALILAALVSPATATPLEDAMDTVFTVRSADAEDRFLGSAFLWGDGQVAVTNAHVVGTADEVRLIDRHGNAETALVIARDAVRDVAVISVTPGRLGLLPGAVPGLGAEVFALGAPLGIEFTLTEGRISASDRQVEIAVPMRMVQHDAAVNPGSSGGPLVDATGALVGMNSQIADGSRMFVGIAYAIPAADLSRIVTGLIDETLAPFPALGMTARPVDRQVADALGVTAAGLLVDGVEAGGLAEASGLMAGDVILAVDGATLTTPGDFAFGIEAAVEPGEAAVAILRGNDAMVVTLALTGEEAVAFGIKTRQVASGTPSRVKSYRLSALGVMLGADGLVQDVTDNSPALFAGIAKGDRIVAVNGAEVDLATLEVTEPVLMLIKAPGGATRHIYLDPWGATEGVRPVGGANVLDPDVVVF
jgi:serine protease Do